MAKSPEKPKTEKIETVPDAWERFEKTIDAVTRKPPKPKARSKRAVKEK